MPNYNKVILKPEIDIRPWSECIGENCQHPDCMKKRERKAKILQEIRVALEDLSSSRRRTARKKIERLRKNES